MLFYRLMGVLAKVSGWIPDAARKETLFVKEIQVSDIKQLYSPQETILFVEKYEFYFH